MLDFCAEGDRSTMSRLGFTAYSLNDRIYMRRVCKHRRNKDQKRVPITVINHCRNELVFIIRSYSVIVNLTLQLSSFAFVLLVKNSDKACQYTLLI